MSNVNNWKFATVLDEFSKREVEYLRVETERAQEIVENPNYPWKDDKQKEFGIARYNKMKDRLAFLKYVLEEGKNICTQHETLVARLAKYYDQWYSEVSNNGKQECEVMSEQADILQNIFVEIWKELKPLGLNLPMPNGMNL